MPQHPHRYPDVPDPERFERIVQMRTERPFKSDAVIVRELSAEFGCHPNTVRNDLRRLREMMAEEDSGWSRAERRAQIRDEMEKLADAILMDTIGNEDTRARSANWSTLMQYLDLKIKLYGASEADQIKLDLLRQKMLKESGMTADDLRTAIEAEVVKYVEKMPTEELEAIVRRRLGA